MRLIEILHISGKVSARWLPHFFTQRESAKMKLMEKGPVRATARIFHVDQINQHRILVRLQAAYLPVLKTKDMALKLGIQNQSLAGTLNDDVLSLGPGQTNGLSVHGHGMLTTRG